MRKPDESLDEFVVKAGSDTTTEPPRQVSVRLTGEVEMLKPLANLRSPVKSEAATAGTRPFTEPNRLSWFHRSLVAGGAFAVGALILASAIFIGIYDAPGEQSTEVAELPEVSGVPELGTKASTAENPVTPNIYASSEPAEANSTGSSEIRNPRSAIRNRKSSAFKPLRQRHRSQFVATKFVPTTLVIFIEKGEIKTRIEPQSNADYKKPLTFSN